MVDQIGIRFVSEGYDQVNVQIRDYVRNLSSATTRLGAMANGADAAARMYLKQVTAYNATTAALDRVSRMQRDSARAAQEVVNAATGVSRAHKSAADSAKVFVLAQDRAKDALDRLRASFDPTVAAELRMAEAARTVDTAVKNGVITRDEATRTLKQHTAALNDTSKANEMLRVKTEMLARAYNPVMAASMVYERQVEQLNQAHQLGVLSADNLEAKLAELSLAYTKVGQDALRAQTFTNQFGAVTQFAGIKTNRFGMIAQQVGYQVGDFFVQVQSGTNVFVAFGQQATQLAGLLPGVVGAIVGIGIAIGTTLLAAWDRTRGAAEEAAAEIDDLATAIQRLDTVQRTTAANFEAGLTAAFKGSETAVGRLLDRLREAEFAAAMEPLNALINEISAGVDRVDAALSTLVEANRMEASGEVIGSVMQRYFDDARDLVGANLGVAASYDEIRAALDAITTSQTTQELVTNMAEALQLAQAAGGAVGNELADALVEAAREAGILEQILVLSEDAARDLERAVDQVRGGMLRIAATNISAPFVRAMGAANALLGRVRNILGALSSVGGAINSAARATAQATAEAAALQGGATPSVAGVEGNIAGQAYDLEMAGVPGWLRNTVLLPSRQAEMDRLTAEEARDRLVDTYNASLDGGGGGSGDGGGGGGGSSGPTALQTMQAEMDRRRQLLSLTGDQRDMLEMVFEIEDRLREMNLSDDQIRQIAEENILLNQQEEIMKRIEENTKAVESSFESAFVALLTGAKSAREVLADLLTQLAQIWARQAFQSFAGSGIFRMLSPMVGSANGNVFMGGNVIPFAQGGVVSSPTTFPMRNGNTGLMGEAGPEAILPLRRGRGGQLGVSAESNVVVTLRLSGDIDARIDQKARDVSVRVVREQTPSIVSQAVKQTYATNREVALG